MLQPCDGSLQTDAPVALKLSVGHSTLTGHSHVKKVAEIIVVRGRCHSKFSFLKEVYLKDYFVQFQLENFL